MIRKIFPLGGMKTLIEDLYYAIYNDTEIKRIDMTIKITPKMPVMVVDPLKGVGLKKKENSDLSSAGPGREDFHKKNKSEGPAPRWEKGIFIDIYA